ncbi:MAG: hypothetical protein E7571_06985 [Ruminococcaceae bacterium]|nr:hypothetical protein [Oscillospiraceae bacterium]
MKKVVSVFLAVLLMITSSMLAPVSAYSASKMYAEDKLIEIQKTTGFIHGKTAIVTGNCYLFVSKVCEKLYGVKYDGEGLYGNYRAKHLTGNYYTVDTYTTTHTSPTSADVENIISFFTKTAAPGDIVHYGAYTTGTSNSSTHTFMISSIDNEKMGIYHANYQTVDCGRDTCHVDYIYWDSLRKSPTKNVLTSSGSLYSMNALFYNKMKSTGLGISINRYTNYESKYYLVGASVPMVSLSRSGSYSVKVSWDEIIGATKYQVQYKLSNATEYTNATTSCTALSYNIENLEIGKLYSFRVRAYAGKSWMGWSDEKSGRVLPPTVSSVTFTLKSNGLYMKWAKRSDISGVRVYRSDSESGTYDLVRDITDTSICTLLDKKVDYGKDYYYKFERYLDVDGTTYKTLSPAKKAAYTLEEPSVTYTNTSTTSADFSLKANGTSDKFVYYVTDANGKTIVSSKETDSSDISITSLGSCKAYRFYAAQKTAVGTGDYTKVAFRALPAKVSGVKAANVTTGIKVSFKGQDDATAYAVYRSSEKDGEYDKIADLDGSDNTSYTDKNVKYNTPYYYKVSAAGVLSEKLFYGELSDAATGKNTVGKVDTIKVIVRTPASFTVKWNEAKNATKYTLQYKQRGGSKWITVGTVNGNAKVVAGLKLGYEYLFRVRAANTIGAGVWSSAVSRKTVVPKPETPTAKLVTTGVRVFWNNQSYATGYKIYRSTSKTGKYSLVKTVKNNTSSAWTDTSAAYGKGYYYKVQCYKTAGGKTYNSSQSDCVYKKFRLATPKLTVTAGENSAEVKWNRVEGAEKYILQYKVDNESYKSVTVKECAKTVTSLESGRTYTFRAKAVSAKGSSSYCTAQSVEI